MDYPKQKSNRLFTLTTKQNEPHKISIKETGRLMRGTRIHSNTYIPSRKRHSRHEEGGTHKHTDTQTHRHMHAQTPRHMHTHTPRYMHTDTPHETCTPKHPDTQTHRHTE